MTKEQQSVTDWSLKFGQLVNTRPTIPSLGVRKLRAKLILEEAFETITALGFTVTTPEESKEFFLVQLGESNLISIADGIADSLVVQLGTAIACGIDIEPVFEEVMRSNNSKLWTTDELEQLKQSKSADNYTYKEHWNLPLSEMRRFIVMFNNKVIKSPSYSKANIAPLLERQSSSHHLVAVSSH